MVIFVCFFTYLHSLKMKFANLGCTYFYFFIIIYTHTHSNTVTLSCLLDSWISELISFLMKILRGRVCKFHHWASVSSSAKSKLTLWPFIISGVWWERTMQLARLDLKGAAASTHIYWNTDRGEAHVEENRDRSGSWTPRQHPTPTAHSIHEAIFELLVFLCWPIVTWSRGTI